MAPPVFVKIDEYKELTQILSKIKSKIESANKTIEQIEKIKAEEDSKLEEWKAGVEAIQLRLESINNTLHEG